MAIIVPICIQDILYPDSDQLCLRIRQMDSRSWSIQPSKVHQVIFPPTSRVSKFSEIVIWKIDLSGLGRFREEEDSPYQRFQWLERGHPVQLSLNVTKSAFFLKIIFWPCVEHNRRIWETLNMCWNMMLSAKPPKLFIRLIRTTMN